MINRFLDRSVGTWGLHYIVRCGVRERERERERRTATEREREKRLGGQTNRQVMGRRIARYVGSINRLVF